MITTNTNLIPTGKPGCYVLIVTDAELDAMAKKHNGMVGLQIGKPAESKTIKQNNLLHSLIDAWFFTGMHSAPESVKSPAAFKLWLKIQIGVCYECEYNGEMVRVPKSVADYTKDELRCFIDKIISWILQSGAGEDQEIQKILQGLEDNKKQEARK